jgi:hypothetical protein
MQVKLGQTEATIKNLQAGKASANRIEDKELQA